MIKHCRVFLSLFLVENLTQLYTRFTNMVKRTDATQDALDRSAKRSKPINLLSSDSESDLPDLDFPRSARSTQQTRNVTRSERNAASSRDSAYHSELVKAGIEAEDDEEQTNVGNEHRDEMNRRLNASDEHDIIAPGSSSPTSVRTRSQIPERGATVQSSRPTSDISNARENDGDAEALNIDNGHTAQTEAPNHPTERPANQVVTNDIQSVVAEPTVPQHTAANQSDRADNALDLVRQEQEESHVENEQQCSEQSNTAREDLDDLMLIVEEMSNMPTKDLNMMWRQLHENSPHRTAEQ